MRSKEPFSDEEFTGNVKFLISCGLKKNKIAEKVGINRDYFYRIFNGVDPLTESVSLKVKALVERTKSLPEVTAQAPPLEPDIKLLLGRLDQLTKQIADLQESDGVIKDRLGRLEIKRTLKKTKRRDKNRV